jgi:spore germination protein YaaH
MTVMRKEGAAPRHRLPFAVAVLFGAGLLSSVGLSGSTPVARATANTGSAAAATSLTAVDPGIQPIVRQSRALTAEVFGYLPYWRLDASTAGQLQYDLLSTIGFFGLGIKADGNLDTTWIGYKAYLSDEAVAVTNAAHAAGVRVVPTFQLFDSGTLPKMTAFLNSSTAQNRFIGQALSLMERRSADGASLDFEPVPATVEDAYAAFVGRFHAAMKARFPKAILVNATSAGASLNLIARLAPNVEQLFAMTYNYHWSGSTVAGPIAPLDNATRTVKKHITRFLSVAPASKILLGEGIYGYDWPVTSNAPYATVRSNRSLYGGVWSVTYRSVHDFLAAHPEVIPQEDTVQGSGWFSYRDTEYNTWREVYFESEVSKAAKDDYAIAKGLGGIGLWTLGNDRGYTQIWDVIRAKFYSPVHAISLRGTVFHLAAGSTYVTADVWQRIANSGNVPETGSLSWVIRDKYGRTRTHGARTVTIYPGKTATYITHTTIGTRRGLPSGTYHLYLTYTARSGTWKAAPFAFRQPY